MNQHKPCRMEKNVHASVPELHIYIYIKCLCLDKQTLCRHPSHSFLCVQGRSGVNLKYGVLVLVLGCVSCGVFPWDPEAHGLTVNPHQTRVPSAVHLSDQPGLQPDTTRGDRHPDCQEQHKAVSLKWITTLNHPHNNANIFNIVTDKQKPKPKSCKSGFHVHTLTG